MNNAPILILQMQRMGDLVLSFPLLGWLARRFPGHPLWVLGEPRFFEPLMPLSPQVTYFGYDMAPDLAAHPFHAVINLSHRPEAAALAGKARADTLIGAYLDRDGRLFIRGDWQLYRASLTHNNRYNLFHWADLNALDCIPAETIIRTVWPSPRPLPRGAAAGPDGAADPPWPTAGEGSDGAKSPAAQGGGPPPASGARIGLFLGASEPDKHPDAAFWSQLTRLLLLAGHKPVLLGGEAERELGAQTAGLIGAQALNLCGNFTVSSLARFIGELDLLVTPDTGPMHVAVWTGTPTLNLSLGPVNPWETGPFAPGHHVARAFLDCAGCWRCARPSVLCKERMAAPRVAAIVECLLGGPEQELARHARGLELLRSARDGHGLYSLAPAFNALPPPGEPGLPEERLARLRLSRFWQVWFGNSFGLFDAALPQRAWRELRDFHPAPAREFHQAVASLAQAFSAAARDGGVLLLGDTEFWQRLPAVMRPFSGYIHMYLQNAEGGRAALLHALELMDQLAALQE